MNNTNFSCLLNVSKDFLTSDVWMVDGPYSYSDFDNVTNGYVVSTILLLYMLVGIPWNLFVIAIIAHAESDHH